MYPTRKARCLRRHMDYFRAIHRLLINGIIPNSSIMKITTTITATVGWLSNATGSKGTHAKRTKNNTILARQSIWRWRLHSAAKTGMARIPVSISTGGRCPEIPFAHPPSFPLAVNASHTAPSSSTHMRPKVLVSMQHLRAFSNGLGINESYRHSVIAFRCWASSSLPSGRR